MEQLTQAFQAERNYPLPAKDWTFRILNKNDKNPQPAKVPNIQIRVTHVIPKCHVFKNTRKQLDPPQRFNGKLKDHKKKSRFIKKVEVSEENLSY